MRDPRIEKIKERLDYGRKVVMRPGVGRLRHDYLVPGGPYAEQWDWDAFFIGVALAIDDPPAAKCLRNWALNYIENAGPDGKVAGCLTPAGADPRLHHMKPFLAQGMLLAARLLNDAGWVKPHWQMVKRIVLYRETTAWNSDYGLGVWYDGLESGADNNVALVGYPVRSVVAADLNAFIYRDYRAAALLAELVDQPADAQYFHGRAETVRERVNRFLWDEADQSYYNLNSQDGSLIRRVTYSNFVPLWARMADERRGQESVRRYMLAPEHLWSDYGIRTLSRSDPQYNNANIIKPYSNWQGPVWPIANYLYMHALLAYGFQSEAIALAVTIGDLVLRDIETTGGMHEDYDAETGAPLAAPNFVSWNLLVGNMLAEATAGEDPLGL